MFIDDEYDINEVRMRSLVITHTRLDLLVTRWYGSIQYYSNYQNYLLILIEAMINAKSAASMHLN